MKNKRVSVLDHKFDYLDMNEFIDRVWYRRVQYGLLFLGTVKSILVGIADLWIFGLLVYFSTQKAEDIATQAESRGVLIAGNSKTLDRTLPMSFQTRAIVFAVSIAASYMLFAWDVRKAKRAIASRDISLAYTDYLAYRFYSLRSYAYFCLFARIQNSTKRRHILAFFVYFTLKHWKAVFIEAPRRLLAAFLLYDILVDTSNEQGGTDGNKNPFTVLVNQMSGDWTTRLKGIALVLTLTTIISWMMTALALFFAFAIYFYLMNNEIKGNLKEYVCRKIDKRVAEIIRMQYSGEKVGKKQRTFEGLEANVINNNPFSNKLRGYTPSEADSRNKSLPRPTDSKTGDELKPTLPQIDVNLENNTVRPGEIEEYQRAAHMVPPPPAMTGYMVQPVYPMNAQAMQSSPMQMQAPSPYGTRPYLAYHPSYGSERSQNTYMNSPMSDTMRTNDTNTLRDTVMMNDSMRMGSTTSMGHSRNTSNDTTRSHRLTTSSNATDRTQRMSNVSDRTQRMTIASTASWDSSGGYSSPSPRTPTRPSNAANGYRRNWT